MLDMNVQQIYLDAIINGTKTTEGRLAKEKFRKLRTGDTIRFHNNEGTQSVVRTVVSVRLYPTFEASFKVRDFKAAIPNARSAEDAVRVYEQFYIKQIQQAQGVVLIDLK